MQGSERGGEAIEFLAGLRSLAEGSLGFEFSRPSMLKLWKGCGARGLGFELSGAKPWSNSGKSQSS